MSPAELKEYTDLAVGLVSSPYGGLAGLTAFALYLWNKMVIREWAND